MFSQYNPRQQNRHFHRHAPPFQGKFVRSRTPLKSQWNSSLASARERRILVRSHWDPLGEISGESKKWSRSVVTSCPRWSHKVTPCTTKQDSTGFYPSPLTIHEPRGDRRCRRRLDLRLRRATKGFPRMPRTPSSCSRRPPPRGPPSDNPFRPPLENPRSTRDDPNRGARDGRRAHLCEAFCNRKWNPCAYIRWTSGRKATFLTESSSNRENNLGITGNGKAPR